VARADSTRWIVYEYCRWFARVRPSVRKSSAAHLLIGCLLCVHNVALDPGLAPALAVHPSFCSGSCSRQLGVATRLVATA